MELNIYIYVLFRVITPLIYFTNYSQIMIIFTRSKSNQIQPAILRIGETATYWPRQLKSRRLDSRLCRQQFSFLTNKLISYANATSWIEKKLCLVGQLSDDPLRRSTASPLRNVSSSVNSPPLIRRTNLRSFRRFPTAIGRAIY